MAEASPNKCSVLIVGGGPCGLMLANELGRRGVSAVLVDQKPSTSFNPQANATQARTMEHFRRLGISEEIRSLGLPVDFPTDVAYFTRYAHHELARFRLPSAGQAIERVKQLSGSWSAAELPHRVSQKFVEQVLRRQAERLARHFDQFRLAARAFFRRRAMAFVRWSNVSPTGKTQTIEAAYLVGADGPRSTVRQALGIEYLGDQEVERDFFGGRMHAIYLRAPDFYRVVPHPPAWMNVTFNRERRAFMAAVDGKGEFAFHTQLRPHEKEDDDHRRPRRRHVPCGCGRADRVEILSRGTWTAGFALVAERFQRGRVFIAGDAAHLFTPTGGLGYNTAVEDAVNLGWKLAGVARGRRAPGCSIATRPSASRSRSAIPDLQRSSPIPSAPTGRYPKSRMTATEGEQARREAGEYLAIHGKSRVQHSRHHLRRSLRRIADRLR